jgi:hypothetical protein
MGKKCTRIGSVLSEEWRTMRIAEYYGKSETLIIQLIIRLFQLVFSAKTVFFSHNKSANSVFQPAYQHSRTRSESDSSSNDAVYDTSSERRLPHSLIADVCFLICVLLRACFDYLD